MELGKEDKRFLEGADRLRSCSRHILICLCLILVGSSLVGCATLFKVDSETTRTSREPEVWMCFKNKQELVEEGAQWDFVKGHLDGLKLYSAAKNELSDETMSKLMALLKENDIQLSLETGGTYGFYPVNKDNGRVSAERVIGVIDKFAANGGRVDFIDLDGPISRLLATGRNRHRFKKEWNYGGFETIEECIDQLIQALLILQERYPGIGFFALTNFGNWGYKGCPSYHGRWENRQDWGDYYQVISHLIPKARDAGVNLCGVTVDHPYEKTIGTLKSVTFRHPEWIDWLARIRDLEDYVRGQGLQFNLIVHNAGNDSSNQEYYEDMLSYLDLYREAGGAPDRYIIQSWKPWPDKNLPETEPYTSTYAVKAAILKIKGISD
ncbi:hypothetical protein ACFL1X_10005 [Candidatus Hydrogenedentota bacterium]